MNSNIETTETKENRRPNPRKWIGWLRILIALAVVACLIYTISRAIDQLNDTNMDIRLIRVKPLLLAVASYIGAMVLSCLFWFRVLNATGNRPSFGQTMWAFFASQLGKYVPGKALVVIIRTDIIRGKNVDTRSAAASVFVETLTWVFVGSTIANILLVIQFKEFVGLQITAAILTCVAGGLTMPPVFRKIATRLTSQRELSPIDFSGLNWRVMIFGWCVMGAGWLLNGLSLWLVLYSLQDVGAVPLTVVWSDFSLALACVSLATVAGFVSLLPGGLGVRELVMIPLLGASFGVAHAVFAAILIRFVWLSAELVTSGIIYLVHRFRKFAS